MSSNEKSLQSKKELVKKVQKIVFHLMCDIDDYCRENNIRYYLSGGTCLGAVRHQGFIPWDDDADLMMPRPDYERFLKGFGEAYPGKYEVESVETDEEWYRPAARVWDKDTRLWATKYVEKKIGVFVDVFPIDGLPEGRFKQELFYFRLKLLNAIRNSTIRRGFWEGEKYRVVKTILALFTKNVNTRDLAVKINQIAMQYSFDDSKYVAASLALHYGSRETIKRELMADNVLLSFEGRDFPVPVGYDTYLKNLYGSYMIVPKDAEEKGFTHLEGWEIRVNREEDIDV